MILSEKLQDELQKISNEIDKIMKEKPSNDDDDFFDEFFE